MTPAPSDPGLVYIGDELDRYWSGEVVRGNTMELNWTTAGWDESFVQLREYNGDTLRQTLTCNTTGLDRFRLDNSIWGQLDDVGAQTLEIYVGFQNVSSEKKGGERVETITRLAQVIQQDD